MAGRDASATDTSATLFDRIGGTSTIREAVESIYALVVADEELAHDFTDVDPARLKHHQVQMLSQLLGGPPAYRGRELGEAHRGLGITEAHYDRIVDHLLGVLADLGVDDELIRAVGSAVAAVKTQIVGNRTASA